MSNKHSANSSAAEELDCDDLDLSQLNAAINAASAYQRGATALDPLSNPASRGDYALLAAEARAAWNLPTRSASYRIGKRVFDLALCLAIAPVVGAMVAVIAAAILVSCGRPIFFRQRRIGQCGREFGIWKFRTMHKDAERILAHHLFRDREARREWNATHKLRRDPRITRLGDWLRRTSLDELPQLLNIIAGQMSFVGPRPIVRAEAAKYGDSFPYYLAAVPGVTGLWQVSGRCNVGYRTRVMLDSSYVCNWTFWHDLKILFKTPKAVYRREGAY